MRDFSESDGSSSVFTLYKMWLEITFESGGTDSIGTGLKERRNDSYSVSYALHTAYDVNHCAWWKVNGLFTKCVRITPKTVGLSLEKFK